uniref:Uncharacterized protein n=1 Tax=Glossina brevipalpis TaxID=37001 RepID=A0A1A9WKW9_9MUSC
MCIIHPVTYFGSSLRTYCCYPLTERERLKTDDHTVCASLRLTPNPLVNVSGGFVHFTKYVLYTIAWIAEDFFGFLYLPWKGPILEGEVQAITRDADFSCFSVTIIGVLFPRFITSIIVVIVIITGCSCLTHYWWSVLKSIIADISSTACAYVLVFANIIYI